MKRLFYTIILISISHIVYSQNDLRKGEIIDSVTGLTRSIYYSIGDTFDSGVYQSKYIIYNSKKKAIWQFDFASSLEQKTIEIKGEDLANSRLLRYKYKKLSYVPASSIYIVKNYIFNDTMIDINGYYRFIFTIPDTLQPFIQLNGFLADSTTDYYKLYPIRAGYLNKHIISSHRYHDMVSRLPKPEVIKIDTQAAMLLKSKIISRVYSFVDSFKLAMLSQSNVIKLPSDDNERIFTKRITSLINEHIDELKCTDGGLTANIFVQVDTTGKAAKSTGGSLIVYDSVDTKRTREYRKLFKQIFVGEMGVESFPISKLTLVSQPYLHILEDNILACKRIDSSMGVFNETFELCKTKLQELDNIQVKSPTLYSYKFSYQSATKEAKWKLTAKGKVIEINPTPGKIVNSDLRSEFLEKLKKRKAGRYFVRMCDFDYNGSEKTTTVDSVKLKYKYYTNIGVTVSTFIPVGISNNFSFNAFEFLGADFFVTYHHIGFFGGTAIYNAGARTDITSKVNTTVISGSPIYAQTGLFLGTCNYLYFKAGLSLLNADRTIVDQSGNSSISSSTTYLGFTGGIALIFPVVHIEGGFNTLFMAPYAGIGLNIPLNK